MMESIVGIVAALVSLGVWVLKRYVERRSDPVEEHRKRYERIDEVVAGKDSVGAGVSGGVDLDELERLERVRDAGAKGGGGDG